MVGWDEEEAAWGGARACALLSHCHHASSDTRRGVFPAKQFSVTLARCPAIQF